MIGFIAFIALVLGIIALNKISTLKNMVKDTQNQLKNLKKEIATLMEPEKRYTENTIIQKETKIVTKEKILNAQPHNLNIEKRSKKVIEKIPKDKKIGKFWIQFSENWTGILGSIILVMGVVFFSIYGALQLMPMYRFFMIIIFALTITGISYFFKSQNKWIKLVVWLRSIAATVFLFACIGAVGISGLKWVIDPIYGLILLIIGIIVNVGLSYIGKKQQIASLHVLLSLIALTIAPQSNLIFIIASIVSLAGILLSYREKWDYHLLFTVSLSFFYSLFYFFKFQELPHSFGLGSILVISITALLVHYRNIYKSEHFQTKPFFVHAITWLYFAIGTYMYAEDFFIKPIILALASFITFFMAKKAKKTGTHWLYVTDTVVSQFIALIAIISINKWQIDYFFILGIMLIEVMFFIVIMLKENEKILIKLFSFILHIFTLGILIIGFYKIDYTNLNLLYNHIGTLLLVIGCGFGFYFYIEKKDKNNIVKNIKTWFLYIGILLFCLFFNVDKLQWATWGIVLLASMILYIRQKFQSSSLGIGMLLFVFGTYLKSWHHISLEKDIYEILIYTSPFFILALSILKFSYIKKTNTYIKWIGIYLGYIHFIIISYYSTNSISPLISGVLWLLASLITLELAGFISKKFSFKNLEIGTPDKFLIHMGYLLIISFFVRYVFVYMQLEKYIGIFEVRLLIEIFALSVLLYWAMYRKDKIQNFYKTWATIHPLFVELILLFSIFVIFVEFDQLYYSMIWSVLSILTLFIGTKFYDNLSRMKFYSVLFSWGTMLQVGFISTSYINPSTSWYEQTWLFSCIAIIIQIVYCIFSYKIFSDNMDYPVCRGSFDGIIEKVRKNKNFYIFYPLFISIAVFLFKSFDKSILTLLWVVECFSIFILSIILKVNNFKIISLLGLILCLIRLVFYDLAKTNTLTKGIVFLLVGGLMLIMNVVYNKYKERF